jgi:2-deoxy-D-gluconate 3-dehydrogenase
MSGACLSGKTAFVTGAHRGIGRAIVEALAGAGAKVAAVDVNPAIAEVAAEMGERADGLEVIGVQADVTSSEQIAVAVAEASSLLGYQHKLLDRMKPLDAQR